MAADPDLAKRLLEGDKRALARAISLVEDDDPAGWELVREVYPQTGRAAVVDIIDHADTIVLVLQPGSGDSIQALKAGVMEIPDVIVVNKADHPLTDTMLREIRGVLQLGPQADWDIPVLTTEAAQGTGIEELAAALVEHRAHIEREGTLSERRRRNLMNEVLALATARMRRRLEESVREDADVQQLLDEVVARRLDPASAAGSILEREDGDGAVP